ncbi:transglutaminase-like domain-containing protein [Herbiconiux sp. SYSU D00978]|uniref:transglutaminase-like domain-containing protein n=1 Tax=Herbiconiux sp. SYSU D00978 TaxID=2812562 RepID=UPI001A976E0D|nr:transglutaminase family protein [Herbiconiux sp. SYSU D00978]
MQRSVFSSLELELSGRTNLVLSVAVAQGVDLASEALTVTLDGGPVEWREVVDRHGTRLHLFDSGAGTMRIDYAAEVTGRHNPVPTSDLDLIGYLRPSRYCESDSLTPTARSEFAGLTGKALLDAVSSWVGDRLSYVPGSSQVTDGATQTLLLRQGVCRDYAHLVIALLRAMDVPARLVSVYAPGLEPMDFHAVVEAHVEGDWHVVDATALAPRQSLVRIATGRDAADTAFLTNHGSDLILRRMEVGAVVDDLPRDDVRELVQLR